MINPKCDSEMDRFDRENERQLALNKYLQKFRMTCQHSITREAMERSRYDIRSIEASLLFDRMAEHLMDLHESNIIETEVHYGTRYSLELYTFTRDQLSELLRKVRGDEL